MKILVISQHYYPESFKITDICEELVKCGNQVTVITGLPNYPEGKIYSGYEKKQNRDQNINGVEIKRCSIIPRGQGAVKRFLNYYSFVFNAKKLVRKINEKFDIIYVFQLSPVMQIIPALYYKKIYKSPVVVYCQDIWPEVLTVGGIKKDTMLYKYYHKVSKKLYNKADKILITSPSFADYLNEVNGVSKTKIEFLPQHSFELCKQLQSKNENERINLLYTGNVGKVQNVNMFIEAMCKLKDYNVVLHIVGNGLEYQNCIKIVNENQLSDYVHMYGQCKRDELVKYFELADACILSLSNESFVGNTIPSKLQDYMSVGKPILAAISGDACNLIDEAKCGIYCKPNDIDEFVNMVKYYINNKEQINEYGKNGIIYFEKNFKIDIFINRLENIFKEIISNNV